MKNLGLLLALTGFVSCASHSVNQDHLEMATLWTQKSGEARAISYQAFNFAKRLLNDSLRKASKKPRAIVVDVDETVVDNSPFQAMGILKNTSYPVGWREWIDAASAKAIPGAVEFLSYASKKGVEVFYVTNRKVIGKEPTLKNLRDLGFPVKNENVMLRTKTSSKKARRDLIRKKYNIVLLMGDNLGDFTELFDIDDLEKRNNLVDSMQKEFGKKFIVLPNAMYGAWEGAVYEGNFRLSPEKKREVRREHLEPFQL